jgi:NFU1 iron-sulfur cluster scaffold homolog, mitochondrial
VTKKPDESWNILKPLLFSAILDHFSSGEPVVTNDPTASDTDIQEDDSEVRLAP